MLIIDLIQQQLNASYVHNISPFAIKFSDTIGIRWYGLSYLAGFLAAYFILMYLSKKNKISLSPQQISDFVFYVAVGAILGGRLGYCFFYDPSLLTKFSATFPFWGALEVHNGGMASHGGILGVILACILYAKREKLIAIDLLDLVALTACLGIFFGRLANFVNAELVGRECHNSCYFSVKYPDDLRNLSLTSQENLNKLSSLAPLLGYDPEKTALALKTKDYHFFVNIIENSIAEIKNGDVEVKNKIEPLLPPRYPSQIYAALLEGLLIFISLWIIRSISTKRGVLSGACLLLYPIGRVISEEFRTPDAQIGLQALGLTRGQWISLIMLALGLIYNYLLVYKKAFNQSSNKD